MKEDSRMTYYLTGDTLNLSQSLVRFCLRTNISRTSADRQA